MGTSKGGTDNSGQLAAQQAQQEQTQIRRGTRQINSTFDSQFTPDYYQKIAQGYTDYADPQLDQQYQQTQRQLSYNLARDGNLNSSTSADQQTDLSRQYDANKLSIANQAQGYAQQAQTNVENARNNLISNLQQTGNATGSAQLAADQSAALAAPPTYSALGSLFSTTTNALSAQAQAERMQAIAPMYYQAPYNTGLFA